MQTVIDGPSPDIVALNAMSVARDGTGGLVYTKDVDGVAHVFVSQLEGGAFSAPEQVDAGLAGASSQPVIAASNGGVLLVAFVNGGDLYVAQATSSAVPLGPPSLLAAGAKSPALAIDPAGQGYLVYADAGQVDFASWIDGAWTAGSGPLNDDPAATAGAGSDRPQVAAGGDGIGIAVWGEAGHVYVRRLVGTTPSTEVQQLDPSSLDGWTEISATQPVISSTGYSTTAAIAFAETIANGAQRQTRALYNRLVAEDLGGAEELDGVETGAAQGADQAAVASGEFGSGLETSEQTSAHELDVALLGAGAQGESVTRLDSLSNTSAPDAVPAMAGIITDFVAWQQTPGTQGLAEIRLRYAPLGTDFGPEQVVSNPAYGPTDADSGLVAGGDQTGDAAVGWVQDAPAGAQIVAGQLFEAPGPFVPGFAMRYAHDDEPKLQWSTPSELWGALTYAVEVDGVPGLDTGATSLRVGPLGQGLHTWQVSAVNAAGETTTARAASVFVDTVPPECSLRLRGARTVGATLRLRARGADPAAPGLPADTASGVDRFVVRWGDGTVARSTKPFTSTHSYRRPGHYTILVTDDDRASNRTTVMRRITVRPSPALLSMQAQERRSVRAWTRAVRRERRR